MKTTKWKKNMGIAIALFSLSVLGACSSKDDGKAASTKDADGNYSKEIQIDVFDGLANYMGVQEGWFAKTVKDKFNMDLNIIAPNVAGNGDTLFQTRTAAGNLGDLIIVNTGEQLNDLVEAGLLYNLDDYYKNMDNVQNYDMATKEINKDFDATYAIPTGVSDQSPDTPSEGLDLNYGAYIRWDLYKQLGYTEVNTLEDLLPVMKDMQGLANEDSANGKVYGFSLFSDWDGNMMGAGKQLAALYGYDELGFVLAKADGSEYQSIIDTDSEYIRALKFYYEANQMGLIDPESTTQNYDTLQAKFKNGQVLFSWWPWLGQSAYNTTENLNAGKGFMLVPIKDQEIFSYGAPVYGSKQFIGIGSEAKDPERLAEFINWLYSPEGVLANSSQTLGSSGPKDLTWKVNADGKPELTEFGVQALIDGKATMPEEYGGGDYVDGISALNISTVLPIDNNPETGYPYNFNLWETYQESDTNPVKDDWREKLDAQTTLEYLEKNNQVLVAPGATSVSEEDSSEISTLRNQTKDIIVQYSWQMVFAKNEDEFNSLLKEMQKTAKGLGYDQVFEFDMTRAEKQNNDRVEVMADYEKNKDK